MFQFGFARGRAHAGAIELPMKEQRTIRSPDVDSVRDLKREVRRVRCAEGVTPGNPVDLGQTDGGEPTCAPLPVVEFTPTRA